MWSGQPEGSRSPSSRENPPQIQVGESADPQKEILCKSYTPSWARSNSIPKKSATRIVIGRTTAHNAKSIALTANGFYCRTLVDVAFDESILVRRYLCRCCKRTVSLLPQFALPYLRFGITVIAKRR